MCIEISRQKMYHFHNLLKEELEQSENFFTTVLILGNDKSSIIFKSAGFVEDPEDNRFLWVFTKNMGLHVFSKAELSAYLQGDAAKPYLG